MRAIEATYRHMVKREQEGLRHETTDLEKAQKRFDRLRAKYERKIDRLQPKIRALAIRRAELKG